MESIICGKKRMGARLALTNSCLRDRQIDVTHFTYRECFPHDALVTFVLGATVFQLRTQIEIFGASHHGNDVNLRKMGRETTEDKRRELREEEERERKRKRKKDLARRRDKKQSEWVKKGWKRDANRKVEKSSIQRWSHKTYITRFVSA